MKRAAARAALIAVTALVCVSSCADGPESSSGATGPAPGAGSPPVPSSSPTPACDAPCYGSSETTGILTDDVVVEVSGMAASERTPGVYYVVSDEAGTSQVVAVQEDGTPVTTIEIEGMDARNAEALAVGPCGFRPATCLYIGDIGDHVGRDDVVVYRVPEPDLSSATVTVTPDELRLTYPDAPTDAEALMVDDDGRPLIVSKASFDSASGETGPTRLYRGPVGGGELELLGQVELPDPRAGLFAALVGNVVTDASYRDGRVLLRTYDEVLEYRAPLAGADVSDFPQWPLRRVPAPGQVQSETVTYRVDGCGYLTTSELTGTIDAVGCTS